MNRERDDGLLVSLAKKYGTPLYAYDSSVIEEKIKLLKDCLPKEMNILYSMKANPNHGIISHIQSQLFGVEVASEGELCTAIRIGVKPENIIFVGPGKTEDELEFAVSNNILTIVAESELEIQRIDDISKRYDKKTHVSIRINPLKELSGARIKMGGTAKQFGFDEELVGGVFERTRSLKNVDIAGIHVYMGTQVLDANVLIENFKNIFEIAKNIELNHNVKLNFIDFGGGFGIPYFKDEVELDLSILKDGLHNVFEENRSFFDFNKLKLFVESGRFLVAESGYYLTKILYKKYSRNKAFLITDGGSNHHSSAAGIGRFVRHNFPLTILDKQDSNITENVDVVGPLCTPTDVLAQNVDLPFAKEGDIVAILKSGAYGITASMSDFLSHTKPAEVIFNKDKHYLVGKKGTRDSFINF